MLSYTTPKQRICSCAGALFAIGLSLFLETVELKAIFVNIPGRKKDFQISVEGRYCSA